MDHLASPDPERLPEDIWNDLPHSDVGSAQNLPKDNDGLAIATKEEYIAYLCVQLNGINI